MEVHNVESFLSYFEGVRERTLRVVRLLPPDKLEWACREGRFTPGDLARHIAATERYVFAEQVWGRPARYPGCGRELADGLENVLAYLQRLHRESVDLMARLAPADLEAKGCTPEGKEITAWKLLRAMVEHEVHHRGELYAYLGLLGITPPPLYGLTSEKLQELSRG